MMAVSLEMTQLNQKKSSAKGKGKKVKYGPGVQVCNTTPLFNF